MSDSCDYSHKGANNFDSLRPGSHVISVFDDENCQMSILAHIIAKRQNDYRYIFFTNVYTKIRIVNALKAKGIDADSLKESGRMSFFPCMYPRNSDMGPAALSDQLSSFIDDNPCSSFEKTFIFYFADPSMIMGPGKSTVIKLESAMSSMGAEKGFIIICFYDKSKFSEDFLVDIVKSHDHLMVKASFYKNIDHVEPEKLMKGIEDKRRNFDLYIDSIVSRANMEKALIECSQNCERRVQDKDRELRRAEDLLRSILDSTADAVITRDLDLRITSWNRAAERIFGHKFDEVVGSSADDLGDLYIQSQSVKSFLERVRDGETFLDIDIVSRTKSGIHRYLSESMSPIRDYDGSVMGTISVIRDITERKSTEKSLISMNKELALLCDISMAIGRTLQFDHILSDSLEKIISLMGADSGTVLLLDDASGKFVLKAYRGISDDDASQMSSIDMSNDTVITMLVRSEPVFIEDIKKEMYATVNGERLKIKSAAYMPLISKDRIMGMIAFGCCHRKEWSVEELRLLKVIGGHIGIAVDNSLLYKEIVETRDFMKNMIENSADAITTYDPSGRVVLWNRASESLFGITREEAIGKVFPCLRGDDSKGFMLLSSVKEGKVFRDLDMEMMGKGGKRIKISYTASPLYDAAGEFMGMLAISRDISERKKLEKELLEAKNEAELYVDLMSHDINNLNQVGIGYLELLKMSENLNEEDADIIDKATLAFNNSASIIKNITRFKEMKAWTMSREKVDMGQVLDEVVALHSGNNTKNVHIEYNKVDGAFVYADHFLKDVFLNIIGNAIKYSGNEPVITIQVDENIVKEGHTEYHRIVIEDNGIGIQDSDKGRIFLRKERVNLAVDGAGLGLYIVRSLVERYGGKIWVENKVDDDHTRGSRFVLLLERSP
ncbi:hypothetical protein CUJ83_10280 [Methanocella sp. CWC-04]|uniref:histidine kinase n=1 Tax=Methanooceanicella nereidis TaxID=2052831 RepID=A0AAP2RF25_9EURY|nr:PAS domain S-box protein [Methanocella sp. CWC-04]MCD1295385.1 hypothetical protein [Methanocella sp. CWC-04]